MKKLLLLLTILFINANIFGFSYPSQLEKPIQTLLAFPKAKETIQLVEKQGGKIKVRLKPFSFSTHSALWYPGKRTIILNPKKDRSDAEVIRLVLFELHNAKNQYKFDNVAMLAKKRQLNRNGYIRAVEYIEYQNVMETRALLNEGINKGYYPKSAAWHVLPDFESHFALQKQVGHSAFIGKMYDNLIS